MPDRGSNFYQCDAAHLWEGGAPERSRTPNPQIRSKRRVRATRLMQPQELRNRMAC
jgi:hypothetical protein